MRGVSSEAVRISVSSIISTSSQGSWQDDFDLLGDIFMWGEGIGDGILGGGTSKIETCPKIDALLPKSLTSPVVLDALQVACGSKHAVVLTKQGEVFSWGQESGGRLGHGINADISHPKLVDVLISSSVEFVACGEYHTCAVTASGDLYTWGDGTRNLSLLGHGNDLGHWVPKKVSGPFEGIHVTSVASGLWHTAIVTSAGQLFTFGDGAFGVLGHGDLKSVLFPREVESLKGLKTVNVACGVWHTAAVVEVMMGCFPSGKLFTWGDGDKGQLGHGENDRKLVPTCISALIEHNFKQVACGHSLTVALTLTGDVFTMGSSVYGQLGHPGADGKLPVHVQGRLLDVAVEEISCGVNHVAVLTSKSEVYTWGKGANGRLGHGDVQDRNVPTLVETLKDKIAKSISCGPSVTAAICLHKWVSGAEQSQCASCRQPFSFARKRHNCYNCGIVVCHSCSSRKTFRASMAPNPNKPYRVCDSCYSKLKLVAEPPQIVPHKNVKRMSKNTDVNRKSEKPDVKYAVSQFALSAIPSLQDDGTIPQKLGRKVESTSSSVPLGLLPWWEANTFSQVDPMPERPKSAINLGSLPPVKGRKSVSRRVSPPRSTTPTPTVRGLTSSRNIVDDLTKANEAMAEEILKLRSKVENLLLQNQMQEAELKQSEKRAGNAHVVATAESSKSKAAKEVIKTMTAQLRSLIERLPEGSSENGKPEAVTPEATRNGCHTLSTSVSNLSRSEHVPVNSKFISTFDTPSSATIADQSSITDLRISMNGSSASYIIAAEALHDRLETNRAATASDPHAIPSVLLESSTQQIDPELVVGSAAQHNSEWVEQDEPGVYITFVLIPGGGKNLKRVRFSRKRFAEKQAEVWWSQNRARVLKQYNIRGIEKGATGGGATKLKNSENGAIFSSLELSS